MRDICRIHEAVKTDFKAGYAVFLTNDRRYENDNLKFCSFWNGKECDDKKCVIGVVDGYYRRLDIPENFIESSFGIRRNDGKEYKAYYMIYALETNEEI